MRQSTEDFRQHWGGVFFVFKRQSLPVHYKPLKQHNFQSLNTISNFEVLSHVFQRTHSRSYLITFFLDRETCTGVFKQRKK